MSEGSNEGNLSQHMRIYATTFRRLSMTRLTIVLPDNVTRELRIRAVEVYNGGKGALGKAVAGAIRL